MLDVSPGGKWFMDPSFNEASAAFAWGVPLDQWDKINPEHKGQMIEFWHTRQTMRNWEAWVNRPKPKG